MNKEGFLLVLEGCDGVGKGTIRKGLEKHLRQTMSLMSFTMGSKLLVLQQPTMEAKDEIDKEDPENWLRMLYLFMKDREYQYHSVLKPTLEARNVVLMDRYYHSSCVYQGMMGGLSPVDIFKAHGPWIVRPDLTLVLQVNPGELEKRLKGRSSSSLKNLEGDIGIRVEIQRRYADLTRRGYLEFEECVLIDASGTPSQVLQDCLKEVNIAFNNWTSQREESNVSASST